MMTDRGGLGTLLRQVNDSLLDLIFPFTCVVCGREGEYLCSSCESALPRLKTPFCPLCADPVSRGVCHRCATVRVAFDGVRSPYLFEGPVRDMVYGLKYRDLRAAAPHIARLMAEYLASSPMPADVLAPVPLHRRRLRERGYNQAELLAGELGKLTGLPVDARMLRRVTDTPPQVSIENPDERRRNIADAFEAREGLDGLMVVVVDDVVTTASTMTACATALKAAGARSVWGLALARQA